MAEKEFAASAPRDRGTSRLGESDRLEAFSDGVMAVIITIMAISIASPHGSSWSALHKVVPDVLVYVLSFVMIGIYWNNHHHLLRATERISGAVMWANLFLLFWLSMLPIVTRWVGYYPRHTLPSAAYGVIGLGAAIGYWILVRTIVRANGIDSTVARSIGRDVKGKISIVLYLTAIVAAVTAPEVAYALYVVVAVIWLVPDRRLSRSTTPAT
jgi:uncharacterized membrane protein